MNATMLASNVITFTVQTTIVIAVALMLLALLRIAAPGVRYLFLRLLLAFCLVLPLVQPRIPLIAADDQPAAWLEGTRAKLSLPWQDRGAPATGRQDGAVPAGTRAARSAWASWLLAALLAGACVRFGWMAMGLFRLHTLRLAGEPAPPNEESEDLQARVGARPQIRLVPGLGQPITFGARRAVILLPDMLTTLPPGIQRAVLAHELWHVRRRDWVWVLVEEMIRGALWFHPAMWALISRIHAAREEMVDELAILVTGSRRSYLDALVAFADRPCLFAAAAFARRRHLVHRILVISKESVMSSTRIVACCAVFVTVVAGASWYSVLAFPLTATAQTPRDRPAIPPPPPPSTFQTMEAAMRQRVKDQPNAQNYQALATLYFERAARETSLTPDEKSRLVTAGIAAADSALSYETEHVEAMVYKNLLLRLLAQLTTDPSERVRVVAEADRLRARALELRGYRPPASTGRQEMVFVPGPPPPPPPDEARSDYPMVDGEFPIRVGGNLAQPAKIRDVRPVYPPIALAANVSGVVILEATIDREGKVRTARVLRSIPLLDAAAIDAVKQWEYEPALLNGVPKPVIMTVTVNFSLQ